MTAALIYKQLTDVVEVPALALHRDTDGTEYVDKIVSGKPVKTTVQVGISSGGETQITSGLAAGDQIQVEQAAGDHDRGRRAPPATTGRTGTGTTGGFGGAAGPAASVGRPAPAADSAAAVFGGRHPPNGN